MERRLGWVLLLVLFAGARGQQQCQPDIDSYGNVNMDKSLLRCAQTMNDPFQPITHVQYYVDQKVQLNVSVRFEFNNLVSINELENTATVDFFFRLWWQDVRWNMTQAFWDLTPISVYYDGIELTHLIGEGGGDISLPVWIPDLHFIDVLEVETYAQLIKLRPDGRFYWSRHMVATVLQPDLDLKEYPKDSQHIVIAFESYGLTHGVMGLYFLDDPIGYITDLDGVTVLSKNPIWYHDEGDYHTAVFKNNYTEVAAFPRLFEALQVELRVTRAGRGILVRYALPILILLILCAATFWADIDTRIDTTMTILLSVSALYVVIIDGIPQVGYLTTFDDWIFVMYTTLAMCVALHQIVVVLKRKKDIVPLRGCIIRIVEFSGRVLFGPMFCLYYMATFMTPTIELYILYVGSIACFAIAMGLREWGGLKKSFILASNLIQDKIDDGKKVNRVEMFVMNMISYRKFSMSVKHYKARLSRKERSEYAAKKEIELKKRATLKSMYDSDDEE